MDLKDLWNSLDAQDFGPDPEKISEIREQSQHPVARLRLQLRRKLTWNYVLAAIFVGLPLFFLFLYPDLPPRYVPVLWILLGIVSVTTFGIIPVYRAYRRLPELPSVDQDTLGSLKHHAETARFVMRLENRLTYVIAVPSPAAGALLSQVAEGMTLAEVWAGPAKWVVIIAGVLVSPLTIFLTRWMNKVAFGKELKAIDSLVAELEGLGEEIVGEVDKMVEEVEAAVDELDGLLEGEWIQIQGKGEEE